MSVIDDLKRLERIGSERGKTIGKLIEAAGRVVEKLIDLCVWDVPDTLPRGYVFGWPEDMYDKYDMILLKGKYEIYNGMNTGVPCREAALILAEDIATGWLDEVAEQLEKEIQQDSKTIEQLEEGSSVMLRSLSTN